MRQHCVWRGDIFSWAPQTELFSAFGLTVCLPRVVITFIFLNTWTLSSPNHKYDRRNNLSFYQWYILQRLRQFLHCHFLQTKELGAHICRNSPHEFKSRMFNITAHDIFKIVPQNDSPTSGSLRVYQSIPLPLAVLQWDFAKPSGYVYNWLRTAAFVNCRCLVHPLETHSTCWLWAARKPIQLTSRTCNRLRAAPQIVTVHWQLLDTHRVRIAARRTQGLKLRTRIRSVFSSFSLLRCHAAQADLMLKFQDYSPGVHDCYKWHWYAVPKRRYHTTLRCLTTQKMKDFFTTAAEA
jgi:hypothetical protein